MRNVVFGATFGSTPKDVSPTRPLVILSLARRSTLNLNIGVAEIISCVHVLWHCFNDVAYQVVVLYQQMNTKPRS